MPRKYRSPPLAAVWLTFCLAAGWAVGSGAVEQVNLTVAHAAGSGWAAEGVRLRLQLGRAGVTGIGPAELTVDRLNLPRQLGTVRGLRVRCPALRRAGSSLVCTGAQAQASLPYLGQRRFRVDVRYQRDSQALEVAVHALAIAGGVVRLTGHWSPLGWRLTLAARALEAKRLASMLVGKPLAKWAITGQMTGRVRVSGQGAVIEATGGELSWNNLAFSGPAGLRAGQALRGHLGWEAGKLRRDYAVQVRVRLDAGELYADPVYAALATHPLTVRAELMLPPRATELRLLSLRIEHEGVLQAVAAARVQRTPPHLQQLRLVLIKAQLPNAYKIYLQPLLVGTAAANLETGGVLAGRLRISNGELEQLTLRLEDVRAETLDQRFALYGAQGVVHWATGHRAESGTSRLRWTRGRLFGIPLGASRLQARLRGGDLRLSHPGRLPLLDGALLIRRLAIRTSRAGRRTAILDAELEPISLPLLTRALGWPVFGGSLAGELPTLSYRAGVITLGGELRVDAFGGRIAVADLTLRDPFGSRSELTADVHLRRLDLQPLTETFSFGRITGHLNGDIDGLRLVGWEPAAFRAWFYTPKEVTAHRRISQQALQNLASFSGSGAGAMLSRGFLSFFKTFSYARIGLGCRLEENVCRMKGLAPADGGYVIVEGSGLPRVNVIGHVRAVSWPALVGELKRLGGGADTLVE